jgi:hypothetical protein
VNSAAPGSAPLGAGDNQLFTRQLHMGTG